MNRDYTDGIHDDVVYFTGIEIENTPAKGMLTLFVVDAQPADEIIKICDEKDIKHVYLGANHSFRPNINEDWIEWDKLVDSLTEHGLLVTLDFDLKYATEMLENCYDANHLVIPVISVKLPFIEQFGYNACVKIDDTDFSNTNPGVWVHSLHDLQSKETFTAWREYTQDTPLEEK